jgi:hypothetical protein
MEYDTGNNDSKIWVKVEDRTVVGVKSVRLRRYD